MTLIEINDETVIVEHIQSVGKVKKHIPYMKLGPESFMDKTLQIRNDAFGISKPKFMIAGFTVKIKKGKTINVNSVFDHLSEEEKRESNEALEILEEKRKKLAQLNPSMEEAVELKKEYNKIMDEIAMPAILKLTNEKRDKIFKIIEETKTPIVI